MSESRPDAQVRRAGFNPPGPGQLPKMAGQAPPTALMQFAIASGGDDDNKVQ